MESEILDPHTSPLQEFLEVMGLKDERPYQIKFFHLN